MLEFNTSYRFLRVPLLDKSFSIKSNNKINRKRIENEHTKEMNLLVNEWKWYNLSRLHHETAMGQQYFKA